MQIYKIFRGSMPPIPLESCLFLYQLQITSAEKYTHKKNMEIKASPFKISCYATGFGALLQQRLQHNMHSPRVTTDHSVIEQRFYRTALFLYL